MYVLHMPMHRKRGLAPAGGPPEAATAASATATRVLAIIMIIYICVYIYMYVSMCISYNVILVTCMLLLVLRSSLLSGLGGGRRRPARAIPPL